MGGKKREDSVEYINDASEFSDNRPTGMEAEVFSQPVGFIPRFPAPPKYIKVKAQNRKEKDFDHVFLAQVLLEKETLPKSRQGSDAKIVSINATPPNLAGGYTAARKAVWATEFSKDGKFLAAAGQDKKLRVWQVISTPEDREAVGIEDSSETGSENGIKLNAPVFKPKLVREYDGHTSSILDLSWSKNNFLLSSSMDKTVRLYHISREECLCAFKHNDFVTSIQFHPRDDRFFLAGSLDSKLRLWSIPDKSVAFCAQAPDMVTAVAFTPDGKTAIAGCLNGVCNIYDTEGLKAHSQIYVRSARGKNAKGSKITGIDTITIPRDNPNGDVKLLITSNDSRIRLYNLRDRSLEIKFRGNENTSSQIHASFSDDGKYVICGSEDRKVYIWPTGPAEKQDIEKRPVEIFEAHSAIVTTAILAPTKTKQLLAQSGDPIYDVCNPPPVTLLSRTESVISSRDPTDSGGSIKENDQASSAPKPVSPKKTLVNPAYLARSAHPGGNIIVSADYTGQIKIFRQDCAYQKRRHESWDNNSMFSKKRLGRSGSVTTRTSASSSVNHRSSLNLGSSKNPSADRILNWRNSIASTSTGNFNSMSDVNFRSTERARTPSPKKGFSVSRSSPRHGSTLANPPATSPSPPPSLQKDSGDSYRNSQPSVLNMKTPESAQNANLDATAANQNSSQATATYNPVPHQPEDPLWLQGEQSFMYWNVRNSLARMVQHEARTPGLLSPDGNPLSRKNSVVSQLSSEQVSSIGTSEDEPLDRARAGTGRPGGGGEELKCVKCGNNTFKATMGSEGQKLKCKRCGTVV
jgi:WD repeat-containing protein 44